MKLLVNFEHLRYALLFVALQSCGLTGNNTAQNARQLDIVRSEERYLSEIQLDSNNRLVSLTVFLEGLQTDFQYATTQNFTKQVLYANPEPYLRLPVAKALARVEAELNSQNLTIRIFDAYRPYTVTKKMWEIVPDERYAANPAKGSGHNRGIAIDLTLVDKISGLELPMPTAFDDFSEKAHHNYMALNSSVIANRRLLRSVMEKHGFKALETEWWHYSWQDGKTYSLLDFDFNSLKKLVK